MVPELVTHPDSRIVVAQARITVVVLALPAPGREQSNFYSHFVLEVVFNLFLKQTSQKSTLYITSKSFFFLFYVCLSFILFLSYGSHRIGKLFVSIFQFLFLNFIDFGEHLICLFFSECIISEYISSVKYSKNMQLLTQ